jgi:predicted nucleic acid-binding protein
VGCRFFVPKIADYEVRRELLRRNNAAGVARMDAFNLAADRYLPLTTGAVRLVCRLWAQSRQAGRVTADPKSLDGDVLIAAQARLLVPADYGLSDMVVATENLAHLVGLANAAVWSDIQP